MSAVALIGNYPTYQRFFVAAHWEEACPPDYQKRANDKTPLGRRENSTMFDKMPKENTAIGDMEDWCRQVWWPSYLEKSGHVSEAQLVGLSVKFRDFQPWCLSWFSHWTWDVGQSDAEALDSFGDYVAAVQDRNFRERVYDPILHDYREPICLMGAEDRYRWCARDERGEPTERPPCRCKHCKAAGIIRIDH